MQARQIGRLAAAPFLFAALACSGFSSPDDVSRHVGELKQTTYARTGGFTVGKSAVRLARIGVSAAGSESPEILEDLKDFKVGVYKVTAGDTDRRVGEDDFGRYQAVVGMQVKAEDVLLLSRSSRGKVRELLAVIDGGEQLTVVQLRGDLESILEEAVRMAFARAERSDLAEPLVRSLAEAGLG